MPLAGKGEVEGEMLSGVGLRLLVAERDCGERGMGVGRMLGEGLDGAVAGDDVDVVVDVGVDRDALGELAPECVRARSLSLLFLCDFFSWCKT